MKLPWVANKGNKLSMAKKSTANDSASRLGLTTLLAKSKNRLRRKSQVHARRASHTSRSAQEETDDGTPAHENDSSVLYTREEMLQLAASAAVVGGGRRARKRVKVKKSARTPHQPKQAARAPASEWSTGTRRVDLNDEHGGGLQWANDDDDDAGVDVDAPGDVDDDDRAAFGDLDGDDDDDEDGDSDLLKHLVSIGGSDPAPAGISFEARETIDAMMGADESFSPDRDTRLPVIAEFSPTLRADGNGLDGIGATRTPAESSALAATRAARVAALKQRLEGLQSCGYAHAGELRRLADELSAQIEVGGPGNPREHLQPRPPPPRDATPGSMNIVELRGAVRATEGGGSGRAPPNDRERGKNGRRLRRFVPSLEMRRQQKFAAATACYNPRAFAQAPWNS